MTFLSRHISCKCIVKVVNPDHTCFMIQGMGLFWTLQLSHPIQGRQFCKNIFIRNCKQISNCKNKQNVLFLKKCAPDNALMPISLEQTLVMGTLFCYEVDERRFFKCNGSPKKGVQQAKDIFILTLIMSPEVKIYIILQVRSMKIVFVRVVQLPLKIHSMKFKMIFLILSGILGKQLHGQTAVFWAKQMIKICASRVQPGLK